jgi:hypothetical protein
MPHNTTSSVIQNPNVAPTHGNSLNNTATEFPGTSIGNQIRYVALSLSSSPSLISSVRQERVYEGVRPQRDADAALASAHGRDNAPPPYAKVQSLPSNTSGAQSTQASVKSGVGIQPPSLLQCEALL